MEKGLATLAAQNKLQQFGFNEITIQKPFSTLSLLISQFTTLINGVLFLGAFFSFVIRDTIDGSFILAIVVINALFGFAQEYRAEKSLEKLKNYVTPMSHVVRDGKDAQLPTREIVPGDHVILIEGDRIPADGTLFATQHIEIDESVLTGESIPVLKTQHDKVFSGTLVTKGKARLLVEKTGLNTRFGQIAKTLADITADKTPLQIRLDSLGKLLSAGAIFIALMIIPIGLFQGKSLISLILLSVSSAIAAIPEGLPAVVTIALALGTNRMAKKKAIVRKLPVVETLGAVQVILTDKTGTLTENAMRVKKYWVKQKTDLPSLLAGCVLGNAASLVQKSSTHTFDIIGEKTDGALLFFAHNLSLSPKDMQENGKILQEYPFDPTLKTITTVYETKGERNAFIRGAPEALLSKSSLSKTERKEIENEIERFAKEGLRVIGFARKPLKKTHTLSREELEENITFVGFVGIYDPPRNEAKEAVIAAKNAGIRVVMVTGDNELTATAIAKEVSLIEKDEDVVTGEELDKLSDKELDGILLKARIFARTTPEHKLRLVERYKALGYVVGVTGDGVNDALALKRADVGIAMGEDGTEVAKEASDLVLTDDNFATLMKAVEEGRTMYKNILTSLTYLLTGNLSELSLIFLAALSGLPSPLHPTQILWVNIITDGLPALALAADTKDKDVLDDFPRDPKTPLLSRKRLSLILLIGLSSGISLLITFFVLLQRAPEAFARTFVFNALLFIHLIMIFIIRGKSIFSINKFLLLSLIFSVVVQILVNILPIFKVIFDLQH